MSLSRNLEMISAHLDGEIPEPWRSQMPQFIESSPDRREGYKRLQKTKDALHAAVPSVHIEAAQQRVWESLEQRINPDYSSSVTHRTWWHRAIQIPLPAAAATAIVVVGLVFVVLLRPAGGAVMPDYQTGPDTILLSSPAHSNERVIRGGVPSLYESQIGSDLQLSVQVESISQLLELLAAQSVVRDVTINLPKESTFDIRGEPALLRSSEVGSRGNR